MSQIVMRLLAAGLLGVAATGSALAHATLETSEAPADSTYKAVIRIGHGCEGKPTQAVRVRIPAGVIVAKPMPKAGWQLATVKGHYGRSYDYYGTPVAEGVTEIAWSGGDLPDDWYDEFVFRARLTDFPGGHGGLLPDRPGMRRRGGAALDRDPRARQVGRRLCVSRRRA